MDIKQLYIIDLKPDSEELPYELVVIDLIEGTIKDL